MNQNDDLVQLVYTSAAVSTFGTSDLDDVLRNARSNNARLEVTGMLLFESGSFFQSLEGTAEVVDELYERISLDPRHSKISLLLRSLIEERIFGDWTMGYARITLGELSSAVGLNDFFQEGSSFRDLDTSQVKKLMGLFSEGSYRQRIE